MNRTVIRGARMSMPGKAGYRQYFRESADEYNARADRLEARLLGGRTPTGSPDLYVQSPAWEVGNICCFTTVTKTELHQMLIPMFDAFRRLTRVQHAARFARKTPRRKRMVMAGQGLEAMLSAYLCASDWDECAEEVIDGWLEEMVAPCTWSEYSHFGNVCQKPVPWTKADMGGGRSGS